MERGLIAGRLLVWACWIDAVAVAVILGADNEHFTEPIILVMN